MKSSKSQKCPWYKNYRSREFPSKKINKKRKKCLLTKTIPGMTNFREIPSQRIDKLFRERPAPVGNPLDVPDPPVGVLLGGDHDNFPANESQLVVIVGLAVVQRYDAGGSVK